jgi:hypothetical protein
MNAYIKSVAFVLVTLVTSGFPAISSAQVPVDDDGRAMADFEPLGGTEATGGEDIPLLTQTDLQDLVGPIALYPDDLLAIVLPASTYPLQLVQAQRFLQALEDDPSLSPDEEWDDSVIALLNYPEVVDLLNEDLDWTWRLGEAVVAQQADVVTAVESFRDRAYAAGNLKSDSRQRVAHSEGAIEITPVEDDIIYVPYYEPSEVVVHQRRPVYYYYPRAYPVYYYPYPDSYAFHSGYFWGVTTAFTLGWVTDSLHVVHHSYHGHPYYGRRYWDGWWYRRPTVHVHNHYYGSTRYSTYHHRYTRGDHWRPRYESRRRLSNQRITRSTYYANRDRRSSTVSNYSAATTSPNRVTRRNTTRTHVASRPTERRAERPTTRPTTRSTVRRDSLSQERRAVRPATRSTIRPESAPDRRDIMHKESRRPVHRQPLQPATRRSDVPRNNESRRSGSGRSADRNSVRQSDRQARRRAERGHDESRSREHARSESASKSSATRRESRGNRGSDRVSDRGRHSRPESPRTQRR